MQTVKIDTVFLSKGKLLCSFRDKEAAQDVNLSFRVSGTIGKICGRRSPGKEGQLAGTTDPTDYRIPAGSYRGRISAVKAERNV